MKQLFALILTCVGVSAATPSFSSFNTNQFSTNNLFISIKDGAVITNLNVITDLFINSTNIVNLFAPSSVTNSGDSLWFDVAGEATLTNTMESMVFFHDLNAGDDDSIALDYFVTTDQNFTNYAGLYAPFTSTSSSIQSYTIFGNGGPTEENRVQLSTDATSASIQMLFNGVLTDGFNVATPSGYTGAGTLFLSDDGTYKAAGGVGGDSIWTNVANSGYVTMIPGQTATNTLAFTSGAADNATNILFKVDSANLLSASGTLLAGFGNAGTNVNMVFPGGGVLVGPNAQAGYGNLISESFVGLRDIALGDDYSNLLLVQVSTNSDPIAYVQGYIDSTTTALSVLHELNPTFSLIDAVDIRTDFQPAVAPSGSAVAYKFDTANLLEPGDSLVHIKNSTTNQMVIGPTGEIALGRGIASFFGSISDGEALVSLRDATEGEPDGNQIDLITLTADGQNRARLVASGNGTSFTLTHKGTSRTDLQPGVTSTGSSIAYEFDTSNTLTNGDKFVSVQNAGTEVLNISPNSTGAQIVFGPGSTNVLYRSGTDLIYTNGMTGVSAMYFKVVNGAGNELRLGQNAGGVPEVKSSTTSLYLDQTGGNGGLVLNNSQFGPQTAGTLDNGQFATAWATLSLTNEIRWQMSGVATNLLMDAWGTATPEGAKTALPGSTFRNTAGVLSVKTDGTGTEGWQPVHVGNQAYLAANGTVSDATLVNLSLSVGVTSGKKYAFRCVLYCANSTAADGVKIDFDGGSAAATNFRAHTKITDAALLTSTQTSALATDITAATITGDTEIEVNGSFEPSGTGTFIPRFAENADGGGTLTVYRGSHLILTEIP